MIKYVSNRQRSLERSLAIQELHEQPVCERAGGEDALAKHNRCFHHWMLDGNVSDGPFKIVQQLRRIRRRLQPFSSHARI